MSLDKKLILYGEEHSSVSDANKESDIVVTERPSYVLHEETLADVVKSAAEFVGSTVEDCDLEGDESKGILYYFTKKGNFERERCMAQRAIDAYHRATGNVVEIVGAGHIVGDSEILKTLDRRGIQYEVIMSDKSRLLSTPVRRMMTFMADVLYKIKHGYNP